MDLDEELDGSLSLERARDLTRSRVFGDGIVDDEWLKEVEPEAWNVSQEEGDVIRRC